MASVYAAGETEVEMPRYPKACDTKTLPNGYVWPAISSVLPYDKQSYKTSKSEAIVETPSECNVFETQKAFDLFSWGTFVALNWPADEQGNPLKAEIGSTPKAPRVWETYLAPSQIFKPDGSMPDAWGTPEKSHTKSKGGRSLKDTSKRAHILDEVDEAFFNKETPLPPIVDLNKAYVRYEVRINKSEYDYIVTNQLYNLEGQSAFLANSKAKIEFPKGVSGSSPVRGAMELKVAWKKLGENDDASKFHTIHPEVYDPNSKTYSSGAAYGMVGMHIMVRTEDAPEWVWATFEHVDNAPIVDLRGAKKHSVSYDPNKKYNFWSKDKGLSSLGGFSDKSYAAMLAAQKVNVKAGKPADDYSQPMAERIPSQITQVVTTNNEVAVSEWTGYLNAQMQEKLEGTVWENYRLISTQWPVNPGVKPAGNPAPISLGNPVMETYMQVNGSCMNCHAGATYGPDGNDTNLANFSFMLQRAQSKKKSTN
ncbi:hypothetical protein [Rubritalea tangerina]